MSDAIFTRNVRLNAEVAGDKLLDAIRVFILLQKYGKVFNVTDKSDRITMIGEESALLHRNVGVCLGDEGAAIDPEGSYSAITVVSILPKGKSPDDLTNIERKSVSKYAAAWCSDLIKLLNGK